MTPTDHVIVEPDIDAFHGLAAARRDIRSGLLPDPVGDDVLIRVLAAAHQAPSMGLSQPWDFPIIRDGPVRERMHALARRQREVYALSLPRSRARASRPEDRGDTRHLVNIMVTCDPPASRRAPRRWPPPGNGRSGGQAERLGRELEALSVRLAGIADECPAPPPRARRCRGVSRRPRCRRARSAAGRPGR